MQLNSIVQDSHLVVRISGNFVATDIITHRKQLECFHLNTHNIVLLDLSRVEFIDSSGVGMLVYLCKRLKVRNAQLVLIGLNGEPLKLFKTLKLNTLFTCFNNYSSFKSQLNQ